MENYKNHIEQGNEHIPTKEEILGIIGRHAESYTIGRELSDEKGLYFLEVEIKGEKAGEKTGYQYMRKGTFSSASSDYVALGTSINVVYFENGIEVSGHNVADYNSETGKWHDVE